MIASDTWGSVRMDFIFFFFFSSSKEIGETLYFLFPLTSFWTSWSAQSYLTAG